MTLYELINWAKMSCNTCARGALHHGSTNKVIYDCPVSKICDCKFSQWVPHRKYVGKYTWKDKDESKIS